MFNDVSVCSHKAGRLLAHAHIARFVWIDVSQYILGSSNILVLQHLSFRFRSRHWAFTNITRFSTVVTVVLSAMAWPMSHNERSSSY